MFGARADALKLQEAVIDVERLGEQFLSNRQQVRAGGLTPCRFTMPPITPECASCPQRSWQPGIVGVPNAGLHMMYLRAEHQLWCPFAIAMLPT